jgi:MFS transporter, PHS family, inorganic phosphate transporter
MQGVGQFCASLMALIMASSLKSHLQTASSLSTCTGECFDAVDKMWRVLVGFGAIPGCVALYYRLTIPETPRYTFDVARDIEQGGADIKAYIHQGAPEGHSDAIMRIQAKRKARLFLDTKVADTSDFFSYFGQWKHGKTLLGTASSWVSRHQRLVCLI